MVRPIKRASQLLILTERPGSVNQFLFCLSDDSDLLDRTGYNSLPKLKMETTSCNDISFDCTSTPSAARNRCFQRRFTLKIHPTTRNQIETFLQGLDQIGGVAGRYPHTVSESQLGFTYFFQLRCALRDGFESAICWQGMSFRIHLFRSTGPKYRFNQFKVSSMSLFLGTKWPVSYNFRSFWSFGVPRRSNIGLIFVS